MTFTRQVIMLMIAAKHCRKRKSISSVGQSTICWITPHERVLLKPEITPRTRAKARHILDHYCIGAVRDAAVLEIWGYSTDTSYAPGDSAMLHVSTTASEWELEVGRDGAAYEALLTETGLPGQHLSTPTDCSINGCGWPVTYAFTIPDDWAPVGYLITFRARREEDVAEEHHIILIRSATDKSLPYVLVCATATWLAYNCCGGSNHYEGSARPDGNSFSPIVPTQRPWSRGFCKLPKGAPRAVRETPAQSGEMVRYPYMEWAYAYGYSKNMLRPVEQATNATLPVGRKRKAMPLTSLRCKTCTANPTF